MLLQNRLETIGRNLGKDGRSDSYSTGTLARSPGDGGNPKPLVGAQDFDQLRLLTPNLV